MNINLDGAHKTDHFREMKNGIIEKKNVFRYTSAKINLITHIILSL